MSRTQEEFKSIEDGKVSMYCCGPTVYNYAHIGNLRTYIFEDLLHRTLEHAGYKVDHVMNITDVGHLTGDGDDGEDKISKRAKETGKSVWDIARFYTDAFFRDEEHLNITRPGTVCKATDHIQDMIELIKKLMPDAFIGVDVMVGCRGEKPELFEECRDFLQSLDVTQLHVFPYSERPGTMALKIPYIVDEAEKKRRSKQLLDMSEEKRIAFYKKYIGTTADVLFEKAAKGKAMHGFTDNYVRVELSATKAREEYDNQIIKVKLLDFNHDKSALKCEIIG